MDSSTNKSCKVISKLLLPEDLIFHILTLVPLNCLFNSARYVCKHWAATIASSIFVESCESRARSKPGLYVENYTTQNSSYFLEFKDGVINGQLERTNLGTPQRMGNIISTCDGILLLRNCHQRESFVVNPIVKCWLKIPPFPNFQSNMCQCTIARVPNTSKFKIFFLAGLDVSGAFWLVLYVLRIGIDNSWKEIARKEISHYLRFFEQQLFTGDNDLYWITRKEVIVIDVDKEIILREYPLLDVPNCLTKKYLWMGNCLSLVVKDLYRTYQIFILDFNSGKWSLYHEIGSFDYAAACGHEVNIKRGILFCFWINNQIIFQVDLENHKFIHFCYNVKTRQLTKIEDIDVGHFEVWLHTNSLVSLPSTPA